MIMVFRLILFPSSIFVVGVHVLMSNLFYDVAPDQWRFDRYTRDIQITTNAKIVSGDLEKGILYRLLFMDEALVRNTEKLDIGIFAFENDDQWQPASAFTCSMFGSSVHNLLDTRQQC